MFEKTKERLEKKYLTSLLFPVNLEGFLGLLKVESMQWSKDMANTVAKFAYENGSLSPSDRDTQGELEVEFIHKRYTQNDHEKIGTMLFRYPNGFMTKAFAKVYGADPDNCKKEYAVAMAVAEKVQNTPIPIYKSELNTLVVYQYDPKKELREVFPSLSENDKDKTLESILDGIASTNRLEFEDKRNPPQDALHKMLKFMTKVPLLKTKAQTLEKHFGEVGFDQDLKDIMKKNGYLSNSERVQRIIGYLNLRPEDAEAKSYTSMLSYLDSKSTGVIHNDLDKSNILYEKNKATFIDWGESMIGRPETDLFRTMMTFNYLSNNEREMHYLESLRSRGLDVSPQMYATCKFHGLVREAVQNYTQLNRFEQTGAQEELNLIKSEIGLLQLALETLPNTHSPELECLAPVIEKKIAERSETLKWQIK